MKRIEELIKKSNNPEEIAYLKQVISYMIKYKFNFQEGWKVVCVKCSCGCYEALQFGGENIEELKKDAESQKCSYCKLKIDNKILSKM